MRKSTNYVIIHCAATPPSSNIGAEEIDRWHRQRGWLKIGYQYVIRRSGRVETGRGRDEAGAHAKGYNDKSVGICMVGGVAQDGVTPEDNFTDEQYAALKDLVKNLQNIYPGVKVIGHNEISSKACPSFSVKEWMASSDISTETNCPTCGHPI